MNLVEIEFSTIKYTRPMMHGSAVKRLQEFLCMLGYSCDTDGIYGPQTENKVKSFQSHNGLVIDGICGPITWSHVKAQIQFALSKQQDQNNLVDIRSKHPLPKNYSYQRQWRDIEGVTLHQTGCNMPEQALGWSRVNAHIGVTQQGKIIILNDPKDMIWHAHGLSRNTIGIEIEGNFCGVAGNLNTLWKGGGGPHTLNAKMKDAFSVLFYWLLEQFDIHGREWRKIYAHRQASMARSADPGEEIWKAVALPWAAALNIADHDGGNEWSKIKGRSIPEIWDHDRVGKY